MSGTQPNPLSPPPSGDPPSPQSMVGKGTPTAGISANACPQDSGSKEGSEADGDVTKIPPPPEHMDAEMEAALGSYITPAEYKNIRQIFMNYDEDGSGSIDKNELQEIMKVMGHMMTPAMLDNLFYQVDVDGSGAIEFAEFVQLVHLWKEAAQFKLFDDSETSIQAQHIKSALCSNLFISDLFWRLCWEIHVSVIALFFWIITLYYDTLSLDGFKELAITIMPVEIIFSLLMLVDVYLCSRTAFTSNEGIFIEDPKAALRHYASSWMIPDFMSAFPFFLVALPNPTAARVLVHLRLLKAMKIPFLCKTSNHVAIDPRYVVFHYSFLPLYRIVLYFAMFVHICTCMWVIIKKSDDEDSTYGKALYFTLYTLTTCGFGDVHVNTTSQRVYSCFLFISSTLLNGIVIGNAVNLLQNADIKSDRHNKLRETLAVCRFFDIPDSLQKEILRFQDHVLKNKLSTAYTDLVSGLPQDMQININLYVRIKLVNGVPLFANAHQGTKVAIALALDDLVVRPEEYIILAEEAGDSMFFLSYGYVDVLTSDDAGVEAGAVILKSGDYFGLPSLFENGRRCASAKALTYVDLFKFSKNAFDSILVQFPRFRRDVSLFAESSRDICQLETEAEQMLSENDKQKLQQEVETLLSVDAMPKIATTQMGTKGGTFAGEKAAQEAEDVTRLVEECTALLGDLEVMAAKKFPRQNLQRELQGSATPPPL